MYCCNERVFSCLVARHLRAVCIDAVRGYRRQLRSHWLRRRRQCPNRSLPLPVMCLPPHSVMLLSARRCVASRPVVLAPRLSRLPRPKRIRCSSNIAYLPKKSLWSKWRETNSIQHNSFRRFISLEYEQNNKEHDRSETCFHLP